MIAELQHRNYSEQTIYSYIGAVERLARHFGKSPTELGPDMLKQFLLFLKNEKRSYAVRTGADQFRLALACQMLKQGASFSEIGELLRHRSPQTTVIYAKVDLDSLASLALSWLGGAR
jgi:hypothetical protein